MVTAITLLLCLASQDVVVQDALPATVVGQVWGDYDKDGYEDLYVLTPGAEDRLFENVGDGTFVDVTEAAGLAGIVASRAAQWGDVDSDGAMDLLLVTASGGLRLYRGIRNSLFEESTRAANLESEQGVLAAGWFDYDHDGRLDLRLETTAGSRLLHNAKGAKGRFEAVVLGLPRSVSETRGVLAAPAAPAGTSAGVPEPGAPSKPSPGRRDSSRTPHESAGSPPTDPSDPAGTAPAGLSVVNCVQMLEDQSSPGTCIEGSSVPTVGRFYPMSALLNVNSTTGNVGIGTISPSARLSVSEGGTAFDVSRFFASSSSTTKLGLVVEHANASHTADGFSIAGLYRRTAVVGNDNTLLFDMNDAGGNRQNFARFGASVENATTNAVSGSLGFWTTNGGTLARRVTIQSDGKVGVGTTNPSSELDVIGRVRMTDFTLTTGPGTGRVLTSDATGQGTWQQPPAGIPTGFMITGFTQTPPTGFSFTDLNLSVGNQWSTVANLGTERFGFAAATADGSAYAMGGHLGTCPSCPITDTVRRYDPASNSWTNVASMPTPRRFFGAASVGGLIYVVGGETSTQPLATVDRYDPKTNAWKQMASLSALRFEHAVAAVNGFIYAVSGRGPTGADVSTNEEYDPGSDKWILRAPHPTVAKRNAGAAGVNGRLYVFGGGLSPSATTHEYDPITDMWAAKASMMTARSNMGTAVANGKIYAIGGTDSSGNTLDTVEEYDPALNKWTFVASVPTKRAQLAASEVNGRVFAMGGKPSSTSFSNAVEKLLPPVTLFFHQKN